MKLERSCRPPATIKVQPTQLFRGSELMSDLSFSPRPKKNHSKFSFPKWSRKTNIAILPKKKCQQSYGTLARINDLPRFTYFKWCFSRAIRKGSEYHDTSNSWTCWPYVGACCVKWQRLQSTPIFATKRWQCRITWHHMASDGITCLSISMTDHHRSI